MKSDKHNRHFTWRPHICLYCISLSSSQNEKFSIQNCRKNENTHFVFNNFFLF